MKLLSMKRALSPFLLAAAVGSVLNCGGGRQESFTTSGDSAVMQGVTGIWMGSTPDGKTYTVTLCEDQAATRNDAVEGCDTLHVVRGGGRGTTETTEEPTGCGGCIYTYAAFVNGNIEGDDLAQTPIHGEFDLSSGDANGPGLPYTVFVQSGDRRLGQSNANPPVLRANGSMKQTGVIDLDGLTYSPIEGASAVDAGGDASSDAAVGPSDVDAAVATGQPITTPAFELHRIGEASCPSN